MSLRIHLDKVKDHHELNETSLEGIRELDHVTRALGMAMWHTHIGRITQKNVNEVLRRLRIAEEVNGAYMHTGPHDKLFTREHVERRIGMVINVATKSRKDFDADVAHVRKRETAAR